MELLRPRGISDQSWEAISGHKERLDRAWRVPTDLSAAVGAAKELCESVARVVLEERAVPYTRSDDMPRLAKSAHQALDRLPGRGQAAQVGVRNLSQAALSIVTVLAELRNELGTGHGRAKVPRISLEAAVAASDAAVLWSRWVLARLDEVLGGDVALLVQELRGQGFSRGKLEVRFDEVGLDALFADDQQRLGVAVAHRAMNGTFVVRESGVDPLLDRASEWPEAYRFGIAEGLLLDPEGRLLARPYFVPVLASVVVQMAGLDWQRLADEVVAAPIQPALAIDDAKRAELLAAFHAAASEVPEGAQGRWEFLTALFHLPTADSE
jgi:Abortive infection C-terminus